jgi:hypothetical protein
MKHDLPPLAEMPPELVAALVPVKSTPRPLGTMRPFRGTLTRYAEAVLEREGQSVATHPAGKGRHGRLFGAAAACGELIAAGMLPRALVEDRLREACSANGMQDERRGREIEKQIASGIEKGMRSPRSVSTPPRESRPAVTEWECPPEVISWKS